MTNLDYHRVRSEETKTWSPAELEAAARKRDATFPVKVAALLPGPQDWLTAKVSSVEPSAAADKLIELCELYLAGTADERVFIRSRLERPSGEALLGLGTRQAVAGVRGESVDNPAGRCR